VRRLLLAALAIGCAPTVPRRVDFSETRRSYRAEDYGQALRQWTRHDKVVTDVGTVIELWGTFKSWDFRQAYIERYAAAYSLSDGDRAALYASQLEASRGVYEIHLAVQTTNYKWNDLEKESSAWRVTLVDGAGAEVTPNTIEVQKLPELVESQFFPNRTEFSRTYLIRFNRADAENAGFTGPGSGRLILRVACPLAKAELVWQSG
jgi:hypothetical protein